MSRHPFACLCLVATLVACGGGDVAPDASTSIDATSETDAMMADDAAIPTDAFVADDAGSQLDSGSVEPRDAGTIAPLDAGSLPSDAGSDSGLVAPDAHVPRADAGSDAGARGCGCERSTSCSDLGPYACGPGFGLACEGGRRVSACPRDTALYWCEGPFEGVTYYYRYLANSQTLEATCTGGGHTFVVRAPPAPSGDVCSCRRSERVCAETYGASCESLACDAPEAAPCDEAGATPGRCVSIDGQLRATFYGASRSDAERTCRDLGPDFYWVPVVGAR